MNPSKKINKLRDEIDEIDQDLTNLLLKRFSITKKIGQVKTSNLIDIDDSTREDKIINHLSNKANNDLKKEDIADIFKLIFNISKNLQKTK
jgi:chorismate mutase|tara:strand:+ start:285 stop:557 length:273 start_codon:yes stop_codon:yes gene_type:complete